MAPWVLLRLRGLDSQGMDGGGGAPRKNRTGDERRYYAERERTADFCG